MHQGQGLAADPSSVPAPRNDAGLPAPFAASSGLVVVPTNERFEFVRAEARESGKVHDLHRMISAMQAAGAKCDLAQEEMVRLAGFRFELERDLWGPPSFEGALRRKSREATAAIILDIVARVFDEFDALVGDAEACAAGDSLGFFPSGWFRE